MERKRRPGGRNNYIWKGLLVLFLALAAAGLAVAGVQARRQWQAQARLERLAESTVPGEAGCPPPAAAEGSGAGRESGNRAPEASPEASPEPGKTPLEELGIPIPEKEVDFGQLQGEVNPDIYAWIYLPDTAIDYPVLQHPTDNAYYLNYNLDGSRGYPGCIYTEYYNAKDFTDPNTVVYGHNMKNGTMFAGLHRFEDSEYFAEHPYVYVYTEEKLYVYEIFAAYEGGDEHILYSHDFSSEYVYREYLEDIFSIRSMNSNIKEGTEVTAGSRILTLSTCVANKPDRRYLVQGVLINED